MKDPHLLAIEYPPKTQSDEMDEQGAAGNPQRSPAIIPTETTRLLWWAFLGIPRLFVKTSTRANGTLLDWCNGFFD